MRSKKEFTVNKIKEFIKNISPFNNRSEMPKILYVIKVILIFWVFKFGAELIGEGIVLAIHFACGKNPLQGELFDIRTINLISYFGYGLMIGIIILLWKLFQKKTLAELGFAKPVRSYFAGAGAGVVLLAACVALVMLTGIGDGFFPCELYIGFNPQGLIIGSQERLYILIRPVEHRNRKMTHSDPLSHGAAPCADNCSFVAWAGHQ